MFDLATKYMGLSLPSPVIASSSPLTLDLDNLRALEDFGAGAVVLPSIFEEQIDQERDELAAYMSGDPDLPLADPNPSAYRIDFRTRSNYYLRFIEEAVTALDIPVIASISAIHAANGNWTDFAKLAEQAGASAIELNLFFVPSDLAETGDAVEERLAKIVRELKAAVAVPVAAKLSPYISSTGNFVQRLEQSGADAFVFFNRFYQPEIDLEAGRFTHRIDMSNPAEARLAQFWISLLARRVRGSLAASTGVDSHEQVVKYILAGADVVMTTSALMRHGIPHMRDLVQGTRDWLEQHDYDSLASARGKLSRVTTDDPIHMDRVGYARMLRAWVG